MTRMRACAPAIAALLVGAAGASADVIDLGNGWEVIIHDPDHSDIVVDLSTPELIVISLR